ncbi:MAG: hypothetical protein KIT11_08965 [Fimbriimonadaceae bacterium]|nr:hypothetical protein [Fimbriimonadaceae bacterium]QYK55458.1 MAG: hypothetical protein KF733_10635 [Fimbriimonadaceae bacterium]
MAQTPPPFNPSHMTEAPRGSGANKTCLVLAIVVVGFCAVASVVGFFFFRGMWTEIGSTAGCMSSFELHQKALLAYAEEHKGRLPAAATWQTDTEKYYARLRQKFEKEEMPSDWLPPAAGEVAECKWKGQTTGVAFNIALSKAVVAEIKDPTKTPLVFEVPTAKLNQSLKYEELNAHEAPKLFMNKRDWIVYYIEGNKDPFESSSSSKRSFRVTIDDALENEPPAEPKTK